MKIFISSLISGFEPFREAVKSASNIEGSVLVLSQEQGASIRLNEQ